MQRAAAKSGCWYPRSEGFTGAGGDSVGASSPARMARTGAGESHRRSRCAPSAIEPAVSLATRSRAGEWSVEALRTPPDFAISVLGDAALVLEFGDSIDPDVSARVLGAYGWLKRAGWNGVLDLVPAYTTLTIFYDPVCWRAETLATRLREMPRSGGEVGVGADPHLIPVCYDAALAPDLDVVCGHTGLDPDELVLRHSSVLYRVCFVGFTPGFPYLGGLDPALAVPRRATPRRAVPAGSVAIGGEQTGIYPMRAPGGWHLIGRTPLTLFDVTRPSPCLLAAGDTLRFVPISQAEYARLAAEEDEPCSR